MGCRFRLRTKPAPGFDGIIHCEVIEAEPPRRFVYTWGSGKGRQHPTTVAWTLTPEGSGTRLVLEHTGFRGIGGVLLRGMLGRGWNKKLQKFVGQMLDRLRAAGDDPARTDLGTPLRGSWP